MHHLVVALLQLLVDVDVLDVQLGVVHEEFLVRVPVLVDLRLISQSGAYLFLSVFLGLDGDVFYFDLLFQVVHSVEQL